VRYACVDPGRRQATAGWLPPAMASGRLANNENSLVASSMPSLFQLPPAHPSHLCVPNHSQQVLSHGVEQKLRSLHPCPRRIGLPRHHLQGARWLACSRRHQLLLPLPLVWWAGQGQGADDLPLMGAACPEAFHTPGLP
jgi:hypothetical protein